MLEELGIFCLLAVLSQVDLQEEGPVVELEPVTATLSSKYHDPWSTYAPGLCIDGDTGGEFCHTLATDATPWIAVDYGTRVIVERVEIFNRANCCGERTRNVDVRISDELPTSGSQMFSGGTLLGHFAGPGTSGQHIVVSGQKTSGRYVIVQMDNGGDPLHLQEVKAFGRMESTSTESTETLSTSCVTTEEAETGEGEAIAILVRKEVGNPVDYFNKNYEEYKEGFSANGESWLGLDRIHSLTSQRDYKLKITMTDFDGKKYVAVYDQFKVGNSDSGYRLTVGGFNECLSTLGDSLIGISDPTNLNGMRFTTRDRDQHAVSGASNISGGWWYNWCTSSWQINHWCTRAHLTGQHTPQRLKQKENKQIYYYFGGERGMGWRESDGYESWAEAEMLLLPN